MLTRHDGAEVVPVLSGDLFDPHRSFLRCEKSARLSGLSYVPTVTMVDLLGFEPSRSEGSCELFSQRVPDKAPKKRSLEPLRPRLT